MSVGWRYIVADLQTYLATGVHARRHLRPWGDLGAEATAIDGGVSIDGVRRAPSPTGSASPPVTSSTSPAHGHAHSTTSSPSSASSMPPPGPTPSGSGPALS